VDIEKLDASWKRTEAQWNKAKRFWHKCKVVIGTIIFIGIVIAAIVGIPYLIWDIAVHPVQRQAFGHGVVINARWYLLWAVVSWVVSWVVGKFHRKKSTEPEEIESGTLPQESIQGSQPKDRRKNHRRVQRRR
jgi:hypothetical protein